MFVKIAFFLSLALYLHAYELPAVKIENTNEPKIILFNAKSVLVNEKLSYVLTWKTQNATKAELTFIGDVPVDGNLTITQEEYNSGPITLTASSKNSKHVDTVTINKVNNDMPAPVKFDKPQEEHRPIQPQRYYNRPFRGPYGRPYNPALPRRSY